MKKIATALLALLFISALDLYASDCLATAGGVSVAIPAPEKLFTEVGSEKRVSFEFMFRLATVCYAPLFRPITYRT